MEMHSVKTDPKVLFHSLLKSLNCDLILDVGSCDGSQALGFRNTCPKAAIVAFEANPHNYRPMSESRTVQKAGIQVEPLAVSDHDGTAVFYVRPADYDRPLTPENNRGCSSLMPIGKEMERVEVPTIRLDTYLGREGTGSRVAIWMDVEGAEYLAVEGMRRAVDKIQLLHVETAATPFKPGQRSYAELERLLSELGYRRVGSGIRLGHNWGDVVFLRENLLLDQKQKVEKAIRMATLAELVKIHQLAVRLKRSFPKLYQQLRRWSGRRV
jgi:FkbM family methyltransferase